MQDLKLSVEEILGRPGTYRDLTVGGRLPEVGHVLIHLDERRPVQAQLRAESVVEGILVTGSVRGDVDCSCARCLTSIASAIEVEVCELFLAPGHEAPPEEEVYAVEEGTIDLEPMLRDALALAFPMSPLCRPDCKGLCARCGRDLNEGPCDCTDDDIDPRWAALAELRGKL